MSRLHERIVAHTRFRDHNDRKFGEEVKEVIRLLEDLLGLLAAQIGNQPGTTNIFNRFGAPSRTFVYPNILKANGQLIPGGAVVDPLRSVKITRAEVQFDPAIVASAATTFTLQNAASSPTSTGSVTVASGATYAHNTSLAVIVGLGQKIYFKAPSAVNDLQRMQWLHLEWESI